MTWTERALEHARNLRTARDGIVSGQPIKSGFIALERRGAWLCGRPKATLCKSRHKIVALIADLHHGGPPTHGRLAQTVLEARNLRMHTGAVTEQAERSTPMRSIQPRNSFVAACIGDSGVGHISAQLTWSRSSFARVGQPHRAGRPDRCGIVHAREH